MDAHGAGGAQDMLPLFEGYLEKQAVENEEVYDRVRQAAVVFMGTLARHMEPGSAKVRACVTLCLSFQRSHCHSFAEKRSLNAVSVYSLSTFSATRCNDSSSVWRSRCGTSWRRWLMCSEHRQRKSRKPPPPACRR